MSQEMADTCSRELNTVDRLARILFNVAERLDPMEDAEWDKLSTHSKEFWVECIIQLLGHKDLLIAGIDETRNSVIYRSFKERE